MAKTPKRQTEEEAQIDAEINEGGPSELERMTDLTRRIVRVPKDEVVKAKKPARRRHPNTPDA